MDLNGIVFSQGYNSRIVYNYEPVIDDEKISDNGKALHRFYVKLDGVLQFEESFTLTIVDVVKADADKLQAIDGSNEVTFQPYDNTNVYTCTYSQSSSWYNINSQDLWSFSIKLKVLEQKEIISFAMITGLAINHDANPPADGTFAMITNIVE